MHTRAPNGDKNIAGPVIRKLRRERGMSQSQLAIQLQLRGFSCSRDTVKRIETGTRFLYDRELLLLSDVFGVPPSILLGEGEL